MAGQEHVATTLKNALASNRVAHAYLFAGPRGTGKTTSGRLMAKALNCTDRQDGEPCNRCESCLSYLDGRAMDLIELDAASNRGIDDIRDMRDKVGFHPTSGDYKVYLIDEVHMLTDAAFNALLKTLEEPPPHVIFILATTEAHKLPATIASRCQRFDFRRAPLNAMVRNLQRICDGEGFTCEPAALELIARSATGSHRDAVNLLDQLATSYGSDLTVEHVRLGLGLIGDERAGRLARMALNADLAGGLTLIAAVRDDGLDLRQFQRELVDELRALLMVKNGIEPAEGATQERLQDLRAAVKDVPTPQILTALRAFGEADLKADPNSTLPLDIALAECALAGTAPAPVAPANRPPAPPANAAPNPIRAAPIEPPAPVRAEPVEAREPAQTPPAAPDPARAEPVEAREPAQTPPAAPDPAHAEPVEAREPVQTPPAPDSVRAEPVEAREPVQTPPAPDSVRAAPVEAREPAQTPPAAPDPARAEPVEARETAQTPPATPDPAHAEPVEARGPAQTPPAPDPAHAEPVEAREPVQPASVAATPAGPGLEEARGRMRAVYERARASGFQLGALLNSGCDIIDADESAIVIGFRHPIHAAKASEKANLDALAAIVSEIMGRPLSVSCVHQASVEPWNQSTQARASRSALVQAAQDMGGRILSAPEDQP